MTNETGPARVHQPCYAVGDRVRMKSTITAGPTEDLPAQHFCDRDEVLIVREVTGEKRPRNGVWPVYVSHEHITDRSVGVMLDEIEHISRPPVTSHHRDTARAVAPLHAGMGVVMNEEMNSLIDQAIKNRKWLFCSYQGLWFEPEDLRRNQAAGHFRWGPVNWQLRDPQERLDELEAYRLKAEAEFRAFRNQMGGDKASTDQERIRDEHAMLRSALVGLIGTESREELEQMAAEASAMSAPQIDKMTAINAIRALLQTSPR